jgi:hypothetical protein
MTARTAYATTDAVRPEALTRFLSTAAGQGPEAMQLEEQARSASRQWQNRPSVVSIQSYQYDHDVLAAYRHIPLKQVMTVKTTYHFVGKHKPRKFSLDE